MRRLIAFTILLSLLLTGCKQDIPELIKPVNSSSVYHTVSKGNISSKLVYDGTVSPETEVVYSGASGEAYEVNFKPGDSVSEGDVLYLINEGIDEEIAALEAELSQFETISELYEKLNDNEIANMKNILAGKSGMDKDLYELDIVLKEYEHSVSESERVAELEEKQAYYDELLITKSFSEVKAPCSGIIVTMGVFAEGDYVDKESFACVIAKEDVKYFQFDGISESEIENADSVVLQVGNIKIENPELISFSGEEIEISSFKEDCMYAQVGEDYYEDVDFGQYCALTVTYNSTENVLSVPNESIYTSSDGTNYCLVLNENGKEDRITVETGIETDYMTEIVSGLSEGQKVFCSADASSWNGELETYEINLGTYSHITTFSSAGKIPQITESYNVGYPGKINQIYINESTNVQVTEGQELFTVIGYVDESVYEQAKFDYESAVDNYDSSIESYDAMIEDKEAIMDSNPSSSVEYIVAEYELGLLNDKRDEYINELDENLEMLSEKLAIYESAKLGEEVTITAPATGTLDMTYTLITNAEVEINTNYCTISQPDSYVADIYDYISDTEYGLADYGDTIIINSKNPLTGETLEVKSTVISAKNSLPFFGNSDTLKLNDAAESVNIYVNTATAYFTDMEITDVCVIGVDYLGFEGSGATRKAYVKLQTDDGIVKRYVEVEMPSDATSNVWVKNGLEAGDIVVK